MTSNIEVKYEGLSPETQQFMREATKEIRRLAKRSAEDMRDIGEWLIKVKARLPHGRFLTWLEAEFGWSDRFARGLMAVANKYKTENFSDLNVAPSALILLASPSTPKKARDEVRQQSKNGRVPYGKVKQIIDAHKGVPAPGSFYATWQEYKQSAPDAVHFATTGMNDETWIAFEGDAVRVARLLNLNTHKFSLPGDQFPIREAVKLNVPNVDTDSPAWWRAMFEALSGKVNWYPEMDKRIDVATAGIPFAVLGEKAAAGELEAEQAAQKPVQIESTSNASFPKPGMPSVPGAASVQYPPNGWTRVGVPAPEPPATQARFTEAVESDENEVIDGDALVIETPAAPAVPVLPQVFADSMALIAFVAQCIDAAETAITHFGQQSTLSDTDRIDLDVIEKNFWGAGALGDKARKMLTIPSKLQEARDIFALAQDVAQVEKAIGIAEQLKIGHEAKDRPVMALLAEAQARLMALQAAA